MNDNALYPASPPILATEFTVSQISEVLKRTLEEKFHHVRIRGEISGLKAAASGHIYFNLKDSNAVLNSACWAGIAARLPFKPEEGMEVICTGKISAYAGRSNYQLIVENMESAGLGALLAMLEKRRQQLEKEGLFAFERKRRLPFLPKVIGVVTSPTGAVIRDILHRISDRFPVHVIVWPVLVQGNNAAEQIAHAINGFNSLPAHLPQPELLIVARGGGSIEDLWAFNEEIVVRAAANSRIPLISAVGHETDTTLIDFAADKRAPTPTAAAEIALPVREDLLITIASNLSRISSSIAGRFKAAESAMHRLNIGLLNFAHSMHRLENKISQLAMKMIYSLEKHLENKEKAFAFIIAKLSLKPLLNENEKKQMQLSNLSQSMTNSLLNTVKATEVKLVSLGRLLDSFNYTKVLERGYTMVWSNDNKPICRAQQLKENEEIYIEFADKKVKAQTHN